MQTSSTVQIVRHCEMCWSHYSNVRNRSKRTSTGDFTQNSHFLPTHCTILIANDSRIHYCIRYNIVIQNCYAPNRQQFPSLMFRANKSPPELEIIWLQTSDFFTILRSSQRKLFKLFLAVEKYLVLHCLTTCFLEVWSREGTPQLLAPSSSVVFQNAVFPNWKLSKGSWRVVQKNATFLRDFWWKIWKKNLLAVW